MEDKWHQSDMGGAFCSGSFIWGEAACKEKKKKKDVGAALVFEGCEEETPIC